MEVGDQVTIIGVAGVRTIKRVVSLDWTLTVLELDDDRRVDTSMIKAYTPRTAPMIKLAQRPALIKLRNGR